MVKTRSRELKEKQWEQEHLFARPSDDELRILQKEFVSCKPARHPNKRKPKETFQRRKVTASMAR